MKRVIVLLSLLCVMTGALRAADAVSIATQQEAEAQYKLLSATVGEFQDAQKAQQKQIGALTSELNKLREDVAHNNNNAATQESIRRLNEQILKVDEARIADNKRIQEALERLAKSIRDLAQTPPPGTGSRPRTPPVDTGSTPANPGGGATRPANPNAEEVGFPYVIKPGDSLSVIVQNYRKEKINVTAQSIKDANPGVDWDRLQIGKKIFIPKPAK